MGSLHVACAADDSYLPHSAAMLHSVLAHRGSRRVAIHFLCDPGISDRGTRELAGMVERQGGTIEFLRIEAEKVAGLPVLDFISAPMWYRIYLPELLPDVERILYLDVDTIAVDTLEPLAEINLTDRHVGAVTNVMPAHERDRPRELGLPAGQAYFNSGVLLMNLELMRRDNCSEGLAEYARRRGANLSYPDQDALNVVLGAKRLALHPRWNCMNSLSVYAWSEDVFGPEALAEAIREPAIRHFEGPSVNKPWHYLCERPMKNVYFEHRLQTPWPEVRIEGRTIRNRIGRGVRSLRQQRSSQEPTNA